MNFVKLDEFMVKGGGSIDPKRFSEEVFELFSIPAFDTGAPEIVKGAEIGSTKKCVEPNDVLLSKIVPHIRRCFVVPKIGKLRQIASGEWIQFRSEKLIPDYLKFFLISNTFHGQFMSTVKGVGGSLLRASPSQVANIKIPLPPLAEQQKIAAILDAAGSLRQKDQQLVERYTALTQSLFLEMFGDPVTNPMGWKCQSLGDMMSYLTSGSRGWAKYYSDDGDVFLRIQNIGKNRLILNDTTYVNAPINAEAKRTKVEAGDILLSITADLGRTAVIPDNFPTAYINQHLAILRLKRDYLPFYVSQFIASIGGERQFLKLDKGGVKAGLNFDDIKSLTILNPPITLQNQFAELIQLIEAQKQQAQQSLEKSASLFNSLLQRAFTGELTA